MLPVYRKWNSSFSVYDVLKEVLRLFHDSNTKCNMDDDIAKVYRFNKQLFAKNAREKTMMYAQY